MPAPKKATKKKADVVTVSAAPLNWRIVYLGRAFSLREVEAALCATYFGGPKP